MEHDQELKSYRKKLNNMDNEFLGYEFADVIGDECNDFESMMFHYGRDFVIDRLVDSFEYNLSFGGRHEKI